MKEVIQTEQRTEKEKETKTTVNNSSHNSRDSNTQINYSIYMSAETTVCRTDASRSYGDSPRQHIHIHRDHCHLCTHSQQQHHWEQMSNGYTDRAQG